MGVWDRRRERGREMREGERKGERDKYILIRVLIALVIQYGNRTPSIKRKGKARNYEREREKRSESIYFSVPNCGQSLLIFSLII